MTKRILLICIGMMAMVSSSFAQTYSSLAGGLIPDDGLDHDYSLSVSGLSSSSLSSALGLLSVCVDIDHSWDSDLNVELISPSGRHVLLFSGVGGDGDNFDGSCLRMDAPTGIASGWAPFTGSYKPMGNLGNINDSTNGNGVWILRIRDTYPADEGFLNSWSLTFDTAAPTPYVFHSSNLPLVIINTDGGAGIPNEPKVGALMKIIYNGPGLRNALTDTANLDMRIGIEIRGAYSSSLPQKPYGFETQDSSGNDSAVSILGIPKESDWILQATYNDKTFVRNPQIFKFARQMGNYATRTEHCELFLNGEYQGIYFLCEKIKRDPNRVNVSKNDSNSFSYPFVSGGYIFKHDYDAAGWTSDWTDPDCAGRAFNYQYFYPKATKINSAQAEYIQSYVDSFEASLLGPMFLDSLEGYAKYIDMNSFVDYLLINEYAKNGDGYKKSMFFHKDFLGKLKAGPVWDFDWALKYLAWTPADASGWEYLNDPCAGDVMFTPWFARLMEDTVFQNKAKCRWEDLRLDVLDTNHIFGYIDSMANYLNEAQERHYGYWGHLGINSGAPEWDPVPDSYAGEISRYKEFLRNRIKWIDANLAGVCRAEEPIDTIADTANSIKQIASPKLLLYPNPVNDWLYVQSEENPMIHISILNSEGKLLLHYAIHQQDVWINTAELPSGIYELVLNVATQETVHRKFIVQH